MAKQRFPEVRVRLFELVFAGAVIFWQMLGVLQTAPYYMNYYNPLLGGDRTAPGVMMIGRGEGLDLAAHYLNRLPDARNLPCSPGTGKVLSVTISKVRPK